jgi:hypothetical protein
MRVKYLTHNFRTRIRGQCLTDNFRTGIRVKYLSMQMERRHGVIIVQVGYKTVSCILLNIISSVENI